MKDMWKHKRKERNLFEPKIEKIWKYSEQFCYFDYFFLLWCWIDLILVVTERELEDLKVCSWPKLQNLLYSRQKLTWKLTYCVEKGNWYFIFSFLGSMCFRVLNVKNIKVIQGKPRFVGCWETLFFINF